MAKRKRRKTFGHPEPSPKWTGTPVPPDVNVYLNGSKPHNLCAPCARKLRAQGKTLIIQRQSRRSCESCSQAKTEPPQESKARNPRPKRAPRTLEDVLTKAQAKATELDLEPGNLQQLELF